MIRLKTNKGDIVIETYADKAPISVKNLKIMLKQNFLMEPFFTESLMAL